MTSPQVEFLEIVRDRVASQKYAGDWLTCALKVTHLVPDTLCSHAAALVFCRWLFGMPPHLHDGLMLKFLPSVTVDETVEWRAAG